jgi:hypothetical protein
LFQDPGLPKVNCKKSVAESLLPRISLLNLLANIVVSSINFYIRCWFPTITHQSSTNEAYPDIATFHTPATGCRAAAFRQSQTSSSSREIAGRRQVEQYNEELVHK